MLSGCFTFVWISVGCLALAIWPFFPLLQADRLSSLLLALALGLLPSAIVGGLFSRRYGIPAAAGFVASSMAAGLFVYIRLTEMFMAAAAKVRTDSDYPHVLAWLIPLMWVLFALVLALVSLRPGEIPDQDAP